MRSRLTAIVIGAAVMIGGYAAIQGGGNPPPETPTQAHLWIDTNGGTCTRSSTPVDYNDAAACSSMGAAYTAANANSAASTVLIKAGDYGSVQCLSGDRTSTNDISFWTASGETVEMEGIQGDNCSSSGSTISIDHVNITGPMTIPRAFGCAGDCTDIVIDNVDGGGVFMDQIDSGAGNNAVDIVIKNSDWGPCVSDDATRCQASQVAHDGRLVAEDCNNCVFENNVIHDMEQVNPGHYESYRGSNNESVTFRGNKWYRCEIYCINEGFNQGTLLIENNWFGGSDSEGGGATGRAITLGDESSDSIIIRFNSFSTEDAITTDGAFGNVPGEQQATTIVGNVQGTQSFPDTTLQCWAGATYAYNIYNHSTTHCGDSTNIHNVTFDFYTNGSRGSSMNYHLTGANQEPDNFVPTSVTGGCPSTDIDGASRPANTNCDAGADERNQ